MKVLVLSTIRPFVHGKDEELYEHLICNLQQAGVDAEGMRLPFNEEPAEQLIEEMLIARQLRLNNVDRVIALTFPTYMVPWPDKVLWLMRQHRQAYDLLEDGQSNISDDTRDKQILSAIHMADNIAFDEAQRIYTSTSIATHRLWYYNRVQSTVLLPPLNDPELFSGGESQGYILAPGPVNAINRQHMLVQALRCAPDARLVVAGSPDMPADVERLRRLAVEAGVEDRLRLDLRFLTRSELARWVNGALAVAYIPFDLDSFDYCPMEAFRAAKPVLTTTDAGGVLDMVRNDETGLVAAPDPEALGAAFRKLATNPAYATSMGRAGRAALDDARLDWPTTIEKLLA